MQKEKIVALSLTGVLLVYLCLRAYYLPLVHDEAATFFHYIHTANYWPYLAHWDANNHIINSALSSITFQLIGKSAFAIRLPNLVAFLLYAFYAYRISNQFTDKGIKWLCFIALITAQFVVEFFALSRGYGLSMAFLLAVIYHILQFFELKQNKALVYTLFFMALAMWSNLSLSNTCLSLLALLGVFILVKIELKKEKVKQLLTLVILGGIPFLVAVKYAFDLKEKGALYYGALSGFIPVTLNTLALYQFGTSSLLLVYAMCVLFFVLIVLAILVQFKQANKWNITLLSLSAFLISANFIGAELLAKLLSVNYPEDRAGLYFIPFGIMLFAAGVAFLKSWNVKLRYLAFLLLFFPIQFVLRANISHSVLWAGQTIHPDFYAKLSAIQKQSKEPITVGTYHLQAMAWSFFNLNANPLLQSSQGLTYPKQQVDYLVLSDSLAYTLSPKAEILLHDEPNGALLVKTNKQFTKELLFEKAIDPVNGNPEYTNFYEIIGDTVLNCDREINLEFTCKALTQPFEAQVVISASDKDGNQFYYDFIPLLWLRSTWQNDKFVLKRTINKFETKPFRLVVYLWNFKQAPFKLHTASINVKKLN